MPSQPPGALIDSVSDFGRALRSAGLAVDGARIALAAQAASAVGLARRDDVSAAMEAVLVGAEPDRPLFREIFEAWFRAPAEPGAEQALPLARVAERPAMRPENRAKSRRVHEVLARRQIGPQAQSGAQPQAPVRDAAMSASDLARLRHADFNALSADEFVRLQRLVQDMRLQLPQYAARRVRPATRGARLHWPGLMRQAARTGGETLLLPRMQRRQQPLPLIVLLDVSGSMERYARMMLCFLHGATRGLRQRDLFVLGTGLTDLSPALRQSDPDAMLAGANQAIEDFGAGTRLGTALTCLRRQHARRLIGRRSLVLLISDGLDTGEPQELARELAWLLRHCRRLLWLNPLLRFEGYAPLARGASVLQAHAHASLAVHNLAKLSDLAASLASLMKR